VLVTNDDGIGSPGLQRLATALAARYDVVVAAPSEDVSGCGTGIGRYDAAAPTRLRRTDLDGVEAYSLKGPPGLAVMAAALGAFGSLPDLVVSGINAGINTGTSIIHSGTVGAVLTARTFGLDGLAVSLGPGDRWYWDTAVDRLRGRRLGAAAGGPDDAERQRARPSADEPPRGALGRHRRVRALPGGDRRRTRGLPRPDGPRP
jgi:broad specificity polyphosphatase/5'/3'-nucleotidase SurE